MRYLESANLPTKDTPTVRVDLPKTFFLDYIDRLGLGARGRARAVKELASAVRVDLDRDAWEDIAGDAAFYVDPHGPVYEKGQVGLKLSARATLRRLQKAGAPPYGPHRVDASHLGGRLEAPRYLLEGPR